MHVDLSEIKLLKREKIKVATVAGKIYFCIKTEPLPKSLCLRGKFIVNMTRDEG